MGVKVAKLNTLNHGKYDRVSDQLSTTMNNQMR